MAIARPKTPTQPKIVAERATTPGRAKESPSGIPGPSKTLTQSPPKLAVDTASPSTARSTTPGRSKDSPSGIPRYFKNTQNYTIQLEEKGVIKPGSEPDSVIIVRPVTPGRRQSTGDAFADILRTSSPPKPTHTVSKPLEVNSSVMKPTAASASKITIPDKSPEKEAKVRSITPGRRHSTESLGQSIGSSPSDTAKIQDQRRQSTGSRLTNGKTKKQMPLGSPLESNSTLYGIPGFFKPTKARLSHIKEREDNIGQVRPEDDPWWTARGGKVVECKAKIKESVEKKLSHVSSKLLSSTESRLHQCREKAIIERPGSHLNPVPKLSSPDAINPHRNVPSRLHQVTTATKNAEWKPKDDSNHLSELLAKKPRQVPSRLLQAPAHTRTTKYHKEADPNDVGSGWVKILPAGSSTKALVASFEAIRPLAGENLTNRWLEASEERTEYDDAEDVEQYEEEGDVDTNGEVLNIDEEHFEHGEEGTF